MDTAMQTGTRFLSEDWHIVIEEQIAIYPLAIATVVEPEVCGMYDAETGQPCEPFERGYTKLADVESYIIAHQDTTRAMADAAELGTTDAGASAYNPPSPGNAAAYDAYLKAWNDQWAAANKRVLWR